MPQPQSIDERATRLHEQVIELVRKYQFRDRNAVCCYGISVSQCYLLEELARRGPATNSELAEVLCVAVSTVTRIVDQLVAKDYVERIEDLRDRRVRRVALTDAGRRLYQVMWGSVLESEKAILRNFPEEEQASLIRFLEKFNAAVDEWRRQCNCNC